MYRDKNQNDKYESIEEFFNEFKTNGYEYRFEYEGKEYQTWYFEGKLGIDECGGNGRGGAYNTFDEMLDNFKADNGKTMREFILEADGAF